jgi:hypothetical protein
LRAIGQRLQRRPAGGDVRPEFDLQTIVEVPRRMANPGRRTGGDQEYRAEPGNTAAGLKTHHSPNLLQ